MHEPGVEGGEGTETGLRWVGPDRDLLALALLVSLGAAHPDTQAAAGGAERRSAAPKPSSSMALSRATMASRTPGASRRMAALPAQPQHAGLLQNRGGSDRRDHAATRLRPGLSCNEARIVHQRASQPHAAT